MAFIVFIVLASPLSNLHYSRPPTAASMRHSRKQKVQKLGNEKLFSNISGFEFKLGEGDELSLNDLKQHLSSGNVKLRFF